MMRRPSAPTSGELAVPGARLFFKIQGTGPYLLMLQGGDGDAEGTDPLAAELADAYSVISYDRRGLSRSTIDDPEAPVDLAVHADDAARLIRSLTDEPVFVFGTSLGGLLGIDLLCRYPELVRALITHEAPATELLAEPERTIASEGQESVEIAFREAGVPAAMRQFVQLAGLSFDDREPGVHLPAPNPARMKNLAFFLAHDAPAVRLYRLDFTALDAAAEKILPAFGADTTTFPRHCAEALGQRIGVSPLEFPGAHNGPVLHPKATAECIRVSLAARLAS